MYLTKKTYVKNWDHMEKENLHQITVKKGGKVRKDIKASRISEIVEEVAYWRKANSIHAWFVENCQDGVDNCQKSYVSLEQLGELLEQVEMILKHKDKAEDILPTVGGFFFGSTDYDKWYFEDMENTKTLLSAIIAEDQGTGGYYYHASW